MQLTNRTIRTTIRYSYLDLLDWFDRQNANVIGLLITALLGMGLVATIVRMNSAPTVVTLPAITIIQTAPAIAVPTAIAAQQVVYAPVSAPAAPRMVVAFASPDGDVLGPIVEPAIGEIVARFGDGWVGTMHDGVMVWVRVSELGGSLANVEPQAPELQPAYQPAPQYQISNQGPPAPPEPTQAPAQPALVSAPQVEAPAAAPVQQEAYPKVVPAFPVYSPRAGGPSEVDFINVTEQWKMEHCVIMEDPTTCLP